MAFTSLAAPLKSVRSKMIFTPNLYPSIVAGHILERTSIKSQTPKGRCHILAWWPLITSQSSIFQVHIVQGSIHPDGVSVTVVHHDPPSWIFVHDLSHLPSHTLYPPGSFLHFTHLTWHTLYHPYCLIILPLPPQHTLQHLQIVRNITEWQDSLSRGHVCLFFDGSELLWQIIGGEGQPTGVLWVHYKLSQDIFWVLTWAKSSEAVRILGYRLMLWSTDSGSLRQYECWGTG